MAEKRKPGVRRAYRIRDRKTGLMSSGGYSPSWGPEGKEWASLERVRSHLQMLERGSRYCPKAKIPESWEVVEAEISEEEKSCVPARSVLKGAR